MSIKSTNPATNRVVKTFEEMTEENVEKAIAQSAATFKEWKMTDYKKRAETLHKVADLLREKKKDLAKMVTMEMGKLIAQAEGEIKLSAEIFDYYANNAQSFLVDKNLSPSHGEAIVRHSPIGVLLGVQPWNFPFYQVARFAAPNIMVGNIILIKHASIVPQCAIAIEEIFKQAGAPAGLYTNLLISGKRATALVSAGTPGWQGGDLQQLLHATRALADRGGGVCDRQADHPRGGRVHCALFVERSPAVHAG